MDPRTSGEIHRCSSPRGGPPASRDSTNVNIVHDLQLAEPRHAGPANAEGQLHLLKKKKSELFWKTTAIEGNCTEEWRRQESESGKLAAVL